MPQKTLPDTTRNALRGTGRRCRTVAALLISGVWPDRSFPETERRLEALRLRDQAIVVGGTLGLLFAGAFIAAQAGLVGLLAYLLLVIVIAR